MTREEAINFLTNTKVYVKDKSKEIQAKLFSLGFRWELECQEIHHTDKPFLFMYGNNSEFFITYSKDVEWFNNHPSKEITAEDILNITIDEPKYRPFKDAEECWQEMKKHEPLGWIVDATSHHLITSINHSYIWISNKIYYAFGEAIDTFTFADGTPFGINVN